MSSFETMTKVEEQISYIEQGKAVLTEATHYFEDAKSIKYLPHYATQILLLLNVTNLLLHNTLPELESVVAELLEKHKTEKEIL